MRFIFALAARNKDHKLMSSLTRDDLKKKLQDTGTRLGTATALHVGAMMILEKLPILDAAWLTVVTATTVGYGDISAETLLGRTASAAYMVYGVTMLAQLASTYFDYRQDQRDRVLGGKWNWNLEDHIVFLNSPNKNPEGYFKRLMTEFRKSALPGAKKVAMLVSERMNYLPAELRQKNMTFVNVDLSSDDALEFSNIHKASTIVVFNRDEDQAGSDSVTLELVARARKANPNARIIAECNSDHCRRLLRAAGADQLIRPMRAPMIRSTPKRFLLLHVKVTRKLPRRSAGC